MLKKAIFGVLRKPASLYTPLSYNFTGLKSKDLDDNQYHAEAILDLYAKRFRKIVLDRTILSKNKIIIPALRLREEADTLEHLRSNQLSAGIINARDEFPDLDVVFENRAIHSIRNQRDAFVRPFHVRVGDEDIRCTLEDIQMHREKHWIVKTHFNRYIIGRPNPIFIPIKLNINKKNFYINKASDLVLKKTGLWVLCYNDEYPASFEIDPEFVTPNMGYRIGDLVNTFPDGVELHPRHKADIDKYIFQISETQDLMMRKTLEVMEYYRKLKTGEDMEEAANVAAEMGDAPAVKKEKKVRKTRVLSLKKRVAQMDLKLKEGVAASLMTAADKKKNTQKTES